jgi:endonuclease-3 related protein
MPEKKNCVDAIGQRGRELFALARRASTDFWHPVLKTCRWTTSHSQDHHFTIAALVFCATMGVAMSILRQIFETLQEYYAAKPDQFRWPQNPVEVILAAILVQGSAWKAVDKVLSEFRAHEWLDFKKIVQQTDEQLAEFIRPVGFQTKKAIRIKAVAQLILERSGGDLDRYFARDVDVVRRELLSISGIGSGTADSILLYAGHVPIYMVGTFTIRILMRHGIADIQADETQIQELIHRELTPDESPYGAELFQAMQELLVRLGRDFCDKSRPDCFHCPLNIYLPEGGAIGLAAKPVLRAAQPKRNFRTPQKLPETMPEIASETVSKTASPVVSTSVETLDLNETERKIVEAIGDEPMPIDAVILAVQLPVHIVRATIAVLQMKKMVCQIEGNQVKRM